MHDVAKKVRTLTFILVAIYQSAYGTSANEELLLAGKKGNLLALQRAIKGGADVNIKDPRGASLLHLAVAQNRRGMALLLFHYGINYNAVDSKGQTPLHLAVKLDMFSGNNWVSFLLGQPKMIIDVHICDNNGNTPLHLAIHLLSNLINCSHHMFLFTINIYRLKAIIFTLAEFMEPQARINIRNKQGMTTDEMLNEPRIKKLLEFLDRDG